MKRVLASPRRLFLTLLVAVLLVLVTVTASMWVGLRSVAPATSVAASSAPTRPAGCAGAVDGFASAITDASLPQQQWVGAVSAYLGPVTRMSVPSIDRARLPGRPTGPARVVGEQEGSCDATVALAGGVVWQVQASQMPGAGWLIDSWEPAR